MFKFLGKTNDLKVSNSYATGRILLTTDWRIHFPEKSEQAVAAFGGADFGLQIDNI